MIRNFQKIPNIMYHTQHIIDSSPDEPQPHLKKKKNLQHNYTNIHQLYSQPRPSISEIMDY